MLLSNYFMYTHDLCTAMYGLQRKNSTDSDPLFSLSRWHLWFWVKYQKEEKEKNAENYIC